jgi:hypothetical protein
LNEAKDIGLKRDEISLKLVMNRFRDRQPTDEVVFDEINGEGIFGAMGTDQTRQEPPEFDTSDVAAPAAEVIQPVSSHKASFFFSLLVLVTNRRVGSLCLA